MTLPPTHAVPSTIIVSASTPGSSSAMLLICSINEISTKKGWLKGTSGSVRYIKIDRRRAGELQGRRERERDAQKARDAGSKGERQTVSMQVGNDESK